MQSNLFEPLEPRNYFFAGQLDPTFGTGGVAAYHFPATPAFPLVTGAVEQQDGKILVATFHALLRFNHNGSIDTSFGIGGVVSVPAGVNSFGPIALQRDGKLVVEEDVLTSTQFKLVLARYDLKHNGALDASFHGASIAGDFSFRGSLAIQPDGKILVAGPLAGKLNEAVIRVRTDGTIDRSFGNQGEALGPQGINLDLGGVAVRSDGAIMLVGESLDINGINTAFSSVFNSRGHVTTLTSPKPLHGDYQPPTSNTISKNVAARPDGLFVIGAESGGSPFTAQQFIPAMPYVSFQGQPTGSEVRVEAITATKRNQIVVGETSANGWTLERFGPNQMPDDLFGPTGTTAFIPLDQSAGHPNLRVIISTADGHLLAIGDDNDHGVTLARVLGSPAPDTTPPTATLLYAPTVSSISNYAYFTVEYDDNFALKDSSIRATNIVVRGPGSIGTRKAILVGTSHGSVNGPTQIATYAVAGPHHGRWTAADNNLYSIILQGGQVSDTSGNVAAAATLGTFAVNVPVVAPSSSLRVAANVAKPAVASPFATTPLRSRVLFADQTSVLT